MNMNILSSSFASSLRSRVNIALLVTVSMLIFSLVVSVKSYGVGFEVAPTNGKLSTELEDIKKQVLKLNRELFILEEDLLFPASTQVAVFVSVDVGRFFKIDSVELKINDKAVAGFLYTERQRKSLEQGGIQRIYLGNLKEGKHQLTAFFTGLDGEGRLTKRAISHEFEKEDDVVMIELKVADNESNYRANINVEEWVL
jgi:hypothetical protein